MTKAIIGVSALVIILGSGWFLFGNTKKSETTQETISPQTAATRLAELKCPEDYATEGEKIEAYVEFTKDYVIAHPEVKGNLKAFDAGRVDFLIANHCITTLENFGYDGLSGFSTSTRQMLIANMVNGGSAGM